MSSNIDIYLINNYNYGLLFNPDHINRLRDASIRVCGHLIGTLAQANYQIADFGAPLLLTNEEIKLIESLKLFKTQLHDSSTVVTDIDFELKNNYKIYLDNFFNEQNLNYKNKREIELKSLKKRIITGKKKSIINKIKELEENESISTGSSSSATHEAPAADINDKLMKLKNELNSLDDEASFNIDINDLSKSEINTEIFLQIPEFLNRTTHGEATLLDFNQYLTITSEVDYKFTIYKHLWSLGYYLTSDAAKFGGDYLVYSGDPYQFHSKFILLCMSANEFKAIRLKELIHYGRMATNVKKSYLIACVMNSTSVMLTCINWTHM